MINTGTHISVCICPFSRESYQFKHISQEQQHGSKQHHSFTKCSIRICRGCFIKNELIQNRLPYTKSTCIQIVSYVYTSNSSYQALYIQYQFQCTIFNFYMPPFSHGKLRVIKFTYEYLRYCNMVLDHSVKKKFFPTHPTLFGKILDPPMCLHTHLSGSLLISSRAIYLTSEKEILNLDSFQCGFKLSGIHKVIFHTITFKIPDKRLQNCAR